MSNLMSNVIAPTIFTNNPIVVAVDPGKTCGVAYGIINRDGTVNAYSFELAPFDAIEFVALHTAGGKDAVVCESFIPRAGVRTWQPDAIETIGALRYVCWTNDVKFELQTPAQAKRFSTNAKLERLGWRKPTAGGHADDASRHLLLKLVALRIPSVLEAI